MLGDQASLSHGHDIAWSNDGHWLLITNQPTGTEVAGFQELYAVDVDARSATRLLSRRVAGAAFAGPGDWIAYSQFDSARGASRGHEKGAVNVGRLEDR